VDEGARELAGYVPYQLADQVADGQGVVPDCCSGWPERHLLCEHRGRVGDTVYMLQRHWPCPVAQAARVTENMPQLDILFPIAPEFRPVRRDSFFWVEEAAVDGDESCEAEDTFGRRPDVSDGVLLPWSGPDALAYPPHMSMTLMPLRFT
jgi:hypothetical protein